VACPLSMCTQKFRPVCPVMSNEGLPLALPIVILNRPSIENNLLEMTRLACFEVCI
jgi:hypothetical protein